MSELKTNRGLTWFESSLFHKGGRVTHAFSTRLGGDSKDSWRGLNLGLYSGDALETIVENRIQFVQQFDIKPSQVASVKFIHSNRVVDKTEAGGEFLDPEKNTTEADGMVTNVTGLALFITFADCVPLLFYDPLEQVIGASHAGWRGTVSGVAAETVKKMQKDYGTDVSHLRVAIGPHISQDHFEVGDEVIQAVQSHSGAWMDVLRGSETGRGLFNMEKAIRWQLAQLGVAEKNIERVGGCTFDRHDLFYSHRREGGPTGRMGAFIMLQPVQG